MEIKLKNENCPDVCISEIETYYLAEYRTGHKSVVFKMYDSNTVEWLVEDPEFILNKIDILMDFYFSNSIGNYNEKYYNLQEL